VSGVTGIYKNANGYDAANSGECGWGEVSTGEPVLVLNIGKLFDETALKIYEGCCGNKLLELLPTN
jgi:hypothetical protein